MRLRFQILSPNNTGNPDYTICSQGSSNVTLLNTELNVKVDDTQILSTVDLSTYVLPTGSIITTNGYTVSNIQKVNTYFIEMDIDVQTYQSTDVLINVSKVGYINYNNVFKVFGFDLGNNINVTNSQGNPVDYNPSMDIHLINETNNVVNGKQTKAFSAFTTYRQPFTDKVYMFNLSSTRGKIRYIDNMNNVLTTLPNNFTNKTSTIDVQQIVEIWDYVNYEYVLIDTCNSQFITAESKIYIPNFETNVNCESSCGIEECTTTIDSLNKANTFIDYTQLSSFYINDVISFPYQNQTVEYTLIDYTGNEIINQVYSFPITNPITYNYDSSLYDFINFNTPDVGDYIVQIKVGAVGIYSCVKNIKLKSCNWYSINQTDCNTFSIINNSFSDLDLIITKFNNDKVFETYQNKELNKLSKLDINLSTDGLYKFTVIRDDIEYSYVIINYCNIKNCLLKHINNILCPTDCSCKDNKSVCDFNSTIILAITFFNMLNSEYNFNYLYTSIEDNKLEDFFSLTTVLNKLNENCVDNDCDC